MARCKKSARISPGHIPRHKLQPIIEKRKKAEYYRKKYVWEWMYVMVTLVDVEPTLKDNLQTLERVLHQLQQNQNAYDCLACDNPIDDRAHIVVGKQAKADQTYELYIMIGIKIREDLFEPTIDEIIDGLNRHLARPNHSFDIDDDDIIIIRQDNNFEQFVEWNKHIIQLMDESLESGIRQF